MVQNFALSHAWYSLYCGWNYRRGWTRSVLSPCFSTSYNSPMPFCPKTKGMSSPMHENSDLECIAVQGTGAKIARLRSTQYTWSRGGQNLFLFFVLACSTNLSITQFTWGYTRRKRGTNCKLTLHSMAFTTRWLRGSVWNIVNEGTLKGRKSTGVIGGNQWLAAAHLNSFWLFPDWSLKRLVTIVSPSLGSVENVM